MDIWQNDTWQDGTLHPLATLSFQYGFGFFETIFIQAGQPAGLNNHLTRLLGSIGHFDPTSHGQLTLEKLRTAVSPALSKIPAENAVLKIIAHYAADGWKTTFLKRPYLYTANDYAQGFSLCQSTVLRNPTSLLVKHKSLNYLENYLARQQAQQAGYNDAFFLNPAGNITECSTANLFLIAQGKLITAPASEGLLPGIMRAKLLSLAAKLGLVAEERPLSKQLLQQAETVFITNALLGAMPVARIENTPYSFDRPFFQKLNTLLGRSLPSIP